MPAGRPSKYTPELLEKAKNYLEDWRSTGRKIPSHIGLRKYLEIDRSTMYRWSEEKGKEEFKDILGEVKELQEEELLDMGLIGEFNATIVKLVLGKHGYSDKQETDLKAQLEVKEIEHTIIDPGETKNTDT